MSRITCKELRNEVERLKINEQFLLTRLAALEAQVHYAPQFRESDGFLHPVNDTALAITAAVPRRDGGQRSAFKSVHRRY